MPLEFIISSKGRSILVHEGYEFWLKKKALNGNMNWRCIKHQSLKCPVTLVTDQSKIIKQLSTHNHECNREKAMAKNAVGKMKEKMTEATTVRACQAAVKVDLPPSVQMALPSKSTINRTLKRHRDRIIQKQYIRNMSVTATKGVELQKILRFLNTFAPLCLSEPWDNTGLLVEPTAPKPIEKVLLTNDLSEDVVSEAVELNAGLILSYHPPIFHGLKKITSSSWKERIVAACLENKIAIYSPHTCWDSVPGGVNDWLAEAFGFETITPIKANCMSSVDNAGAGRLGVLKNSIKLKEAIENVKKLTSLKYLNVAVAKGGSLDSPIKTVAICAGSGSSILDGIEADLYLTGEMSHHSILDAIHCKTSVILCNHSNSERGFLRVFATKLEKEFSGNGMFVVVSKHDIDPLQVV